MLTVQIFQGVFIVLNYYTHQQDYAALCVNKDKPEMHCNGKCQMDKQLQTSQHKQQDRPDKSGTYTLLLYYIVTPASFELPDVAVPEKTYTFSGAWPLKHRALLSVFRPPDAFTC